MEVEFVYRITGRDNWDALDAACRRATTLNSATFSGYTIEAPTEDSDEGIVRLRATGHDRSAITRKVVAPIRAVFLRAAISHTRIQLMQQTITPTRRNLTLDQGRTPMYTYATSDLQRMMDDAGRVERGDVS